MHTNSWVSILRIVTRFLAYNYSAYNMSVTSTPPSKHRSVRVRRRWLLVLLLALLFFLSYSYPASRYCTFFCYHLFLLLAFSALGSCPSPLSCVFRGSLVFMERCAAVMMVSSVASGLEAGCHVSGTSLPIFCVRHNRLFWPSKLRSLASYSTWRVTIARTGIVAWAVCCSVLLSSVDV